MRASYILLPVAILATTLATADAIDIAADGAPKADLIVAENATIAEQRAANELADYLGKIADCQFNISSEKQATDAANTLYVGPTDRVANAGIDITRLGPEEWIIRTDGNDLLLVGGRPRGTLYAVYHFLEDVLNVHWWNPWAETVPHRPTIRLNNVNLHERPVLQYRDIYRLYGHDDGAFAARNRLNRQGDPQIAARYGGSMDYGPPYHVHTFFKYISPDRYFEDHPEYFSLIDGKRKAERAQLCLTNPDVRKLVVKRLRSYIERSRKNAAKRNLPPPGVFSISQNDCGGACQCQDCQAIANAEGSDAGPLLDFLNYVASKIADEYPNIYISTLAYHYTQKPPKTIRPRDNIIIRLCDTGSNFTRAITDPENEKFHDFLLEWADIANNLRVWDYAVTYPTPRGMPMPSVHTYQPDFQFYATHNVEGVFTELEFPIRADMRDLKVWMMMKLLENPYADYDTLSKTFTDGFYGAAGPMVRQYLQALQTASQEHGAHVSMGSGLPAFKYLTLEFITRAQSIFDRAEKAVGNNDTLLQRVRHARMPLDRATVMRYRKLTQQWAQQGNDPHQLPLDRNAMTQRYKATWLAEMKRRLPEKQWEQNRSKLNQEITKYTALPEYLPLPQKFADLPADRVFDFTADVSRNWKNIVKVVRDGEAESGITNRLEFPTDIDTDRHSVSKYKLPMPWGLYDNRNAEAAGGSSIKPDDVPGPGYHWYKMGTFEIGPSYYVYFFWSWIIQVDIDAAYNPDHPHRKFDIWARIKFEGPAFPHGKPHETNAINVERVVLVAQQDQ